MEEQSSLKLHKIYTEQFWEEFRQQPLGRKGYSKKSKEETLRALIKLGDVKLYWINAYTPEQNRTKYERHKKYKGRFRGFKACFACRGPAQVRHHIIWIKNGGRNHKRNIVALCRNCHAEIHPWLNV